MMQRIVLIMTFTFLTSENHLWFLIVKATSLSLITFYKYYYTWPYHNETITTLFSVASGIVAWANISLIIAKLLEHTKYNGGIQLFFLGIPLVISIIVFTKDERIEMLMKNVANFNKSADVIK
jgi:hypothetical protein